MEKEMKKLGSAVALLAVIGAPGPVQASEQDGWQFEITPYAWLTGIDGDVAARGREASFEKDFSDLKDNVDAGFMGLVSASYNRVVLFGQYDYVELGPDGSLVADLGVSALPGGRVDGSLDTKIGTLGIGYRFDTFGENTIDVLVGVRDISIEAELRAAGQARSREIGATDTLIMLRPSIRLSERWRFNPTMSYAVAGDSDTHYELQPEFQYQFSDSFALRFGYRSLNYELESGSKGTDDYRGIDGTLSGFLIGAGWTFPARTAAVAAAPAPEPVRQPEPTPVAAAPAPPADADQDGVPDAGDRCPDTPRGSRVDQRGCDCDVTVQLQFEFDSAVLTAADKDLLNSLADRMREANWTGGVAEGHTDSIGSDAYNQGLSSRRAQAVVDHIASRGVGDRVGVVGLGEAQPVANNATAEGRAQNRRVVLRRTDCDAN
jgi:outer membrane protein OmpA-like peptidoglycan-associated protein